MYSLELQQLLVESVQLIEIDILLGKEKSMNKCE